MMSRGYTLEDARNYCIIGCVEPQACAKTDGWHDAAFFNMLRPLELVFSNGVDKGEQIGPRTGDVLKMTSFEEFYKAYTTQESALIEIWCRRTTRWMWRTRCVARCPLSPA